MYKDFLAKKVFFALFPKHVAGYSVNLESQNYCGHEIHIRRTGPTDLIPKVKIGLRIRIFCNNSVMKDWSFIYL